MRLEMHEMVQGENRCPVQKKERRKQSRKLHFLSSLLFNLAFISFTPAKLAKQALEASHLFPGPRSPQQQLRNAISGQTKQSMKLISSSEASSACLLPEISYPGGMDLPASFLPPNSQQSTRFETYEPACQRIDQPFRRNTQASCLSTIWSRRAQWRVLQSGVALF